MSCNLDTVAVEKGTIKRHGGVAPGSEGPGAFTLSQKAQGDYN